MIVTSKIIMSGTVLITGCSRGIGFGLVKEYVKRDWKVIATCRNPQGASDLTEFLAENGQTPPIPLDVSSESSIKDCKEAVTKLTNKLNVLINNAGISNKNHPDDWATQTDVKEFDHILQTNVTSVLTMTQTFLPLLKETEVGRVINISSGLGSMGASPRYSTTSYQCSKAALNMLTKCFADEVKNVVFVAMHPGWVQTDMGSSKNRKAPVTVADSAKGIFEVAHSVGKDKSGIFIGFDGKEIPF